MKKYLALVLVMVLVLCLVGCNKEEPVDNSVVQVEQYVFEAKILNINDTTFLVKPVYGSNELKSADMIYVTAMSVEPGYDAQIGDIIEVTYDGVIQETYPAQIKNVFKIKFAREPGEELDFSECGVAFTAKDVSPTGLTIVCTQFGGWAVGELSTGSFYNLERRANGGWEAVDLVTQESDVVWTGEAWMIPLDDVVEWNVEWEWLYGKLPSGKYRIGKVVTNLRDQDDYNMLMHYAEFEIK